MERVSDLHSPRVDDQLVHEVHGMLTGSGYDEGRDERRTKEAPEDAPMPGNREDVPIPTHNGPVSQLEIDDRAVLAAHLRPSAFPGEAPDLLAIAAEEEMPERLLDLLEQLPPGTYENVQQVWIALGGHDEGTH